MKAIIILSTTVFLLLSIQHSAAQQLSFTYDASGNQTNRDWICVGCLTAEYVLVNLGSDRLKLQTETHTKILRISRVNRHIVPLDQIIISDTTGTNLSIKKIKRKNPKAAIQI